MNVTYLPDQYGISVLLTWDDKTIFNETISGKKKKRRSTTQITKLRDVVIQILFSFVGGSSELTMWLTDVFWSLFWKVGGGAVRIHVTHMWRGHSCVGVTHVWRGHSHVGVTHVCGTSHQNEILHSLISIQFAISVFCSTFRNRCFYNLE